MKKYDEPRGDRVKLPKSWSELRPGLRWLWASINKFNGHGGPGGHIKIVDFVEFFVGQNQKSSRIVPYGSETALKLKERLHCVRQRSLAVSKSTVTAPPAVVPCRVHSNFLHRARQALLG